MNRNDLHPYQKRAVQFIHDVPKAALFLEMGLGKTVSTLTALQDLKESKQFTKTLIIAPLRVANSVWIKESEKWSHIDLTFSLCTGTAAKRDKGLEADVDVYIINRENIPWLVKKYSMGMKWPFNTVVIDESSSFKSPAAKRFKALKKMLPKISRMVLLSGTPSPNGMLDLFSQIFLLDNGASLGRTMTKYKERYFSSDFFGYTWTLKPGSQKQIQKLISPMCISMSAADYLDMPTRIDNTIEVTLPPKALKQYQELEREFILELDDEVITAVSSAVLAGKLLQCSSGALYDSEGSFIELHDAKLDALAEIVEANPDPILVAYNFKSDLARLQSRFPDAVTLDKEGAVVDEWNNGDVQMLLAHPASAGHGLNLQSGGSTIVWFSLNWSLEYYQQFNARLHRQGQTSNVIVHHLVATGSIDELVVKNLKSKDVSQSSLLLSLKAKIESSLK